MMDIAKMSQSAIKDKQKGKTLEGIIQTQKKNKRQFVSTKELEVDEMYQKFIRPQSDTEAEQFRQSVEKEGIRDALVVYERAGQLVVVDGHHRLKAAQELNIQNVPITELIFKNQDEARLWMLQNQLGRRNLNDAERIDISLKLTEFLEKLGLANKLSGKNLEEAQEDTNQKIDRLQTAADLASVSRRNVAKFKKIQETAPETVSEEVLQGKKSIHKAYQELSESQKPKIEISQNQVEDKMTFPKEVESLFKKIGQWKNGKIDDRRLKMILLEHLKK